MEISPPGSEPAYVNRPLFTKPYRHLRFEPVRCAEDAQPPEPRRHALRKGLVALGMASLILWAGIYLLGDEPSRFSGDGSGVFADVSWSGGFVYVSIVALIVFLGALLFRYVALLLGSFGHLLQRTLRQEPEQVELPPISIIVPAYNEGVLLRGTLASLLKLDYPAYEIIVVDDGSHDDTRTIAQEYVGLHGHVEVRLVAKPNGGKATALNAGILCSQHDFVLCVDGDSQLSANTLRKAIVHFADPKIGAVAGNVKVVNRGKVWTKLQALEYVEGLNMMRSAQSLLKLVNLIPGPLGLFRKRAIVEAGWYSSKTFAEDCDITLKIIRNGWRVVYEPEAQSFTEAPERITHLLKQRYRWTRGILQVVHKHRDLFFNPTINLRGTFVMWSMAFESLIWPMMNLFASLYFIVVAVFFDVSYYLVFWWISLTLLDMVAALYCVASEREEVGLVFYSVFYRIFFVLIIDVCKALATIEEFLGVGMTWGKLDRVGNTT